jgi:hypothetical protein
MKKKHVPTTAITIRTYAELHDFAVRFAKGCYNLLAVVGTAGLSKSKTFEHVMQDVDHCLVKGNATAFILYKTLFDHLHEPVIIDDADTLYEDKRCQPLLKCLCDTTKEKTIAWHSKAMDDDEYPRSFKTTSKVVILCNEWRTVSQNMKAVTDRGIFLNFLPTVYEVHRQVAAGNWLKDDEVYDYIGANLNLVTVPSMRYYYKAKELKDSHIPNWKELVLNMLNPDLDRKAVEVVAKLLDDSVIPEAKKLERFVRLTSLSRATYFRYKRALEDARGAGEALTPVTTTRTRRAMPSKKLGHIADTMVDLSKKQAIYQAVCADGLVGNAQRREFARRVSEAKLGHGSLAKFVRYQEAALRA